MQLAQVFVPPADLTKRWPQWRRCGMLRGRHVVLAFDEGSQSEGLQLLAWHIEARNARSGCGSRELSQEDSRDNSSFSKCNCSEGAGFSSEIEMRIPRSTRLMWLGRKGLASRLRLKRLQRPPSLCYGAGNSLGIYEWMSGKVLWNDVQREGAKSSSDVSFDIRNKANSSNTCGCYWLC